MILWIDGGNSGHVVNQGYGSFKLYTDSGELIHHTNRHIFLGHMTNNEAEYHTLILALEWIDDNIDDPESAYGTLIIKGDSELVRNQVLGNWRVNKEHLLPLCLRARELLDFYTRYEYYHVPREYIVKELGH